MNEVQLLFVVLAVLYGWECACWLRRGAVAFSTWLGPCNGVPSPKSGVPSPESTVRSPESRVADSHTDGGLDSGLGTPAFRARQSALPARRRRDSGLSRGRWRIWHPGTLIGNQSGGFILAPPLPPLGTLFVAHQFPLSISADGVLAFVATNVNPGWRPAQSGRFVRFEDLRGTRARGCKLLVNGVQLATYSSPGLARRCVELLQQLAKLKPAQREAAIAENLGGAFDPTAVERRRQEFQTRARPVRGLSNALLGYLFGVVPVVIWHFGFKLSWLGLLAGLLGLTSATAFCFFRAHRALYPDAEDERFTHTLTILLAPTTAMRAHDALSRPLMEDFHPLAIAHLLLPEKDFREFARRVLLDLRQPALPLCPNDNKAPRETELLARRALQSEVEKFLKQAGVEPDDLCRPPTPADESCRSYCPRCNAQFTTVEGTCADCGGLGLVPFGPAE